MPAVKLARTGDTTTDRNNDELLRIIRDGLVAGKLDGVIRSLNTGVNKLRPAIPHPRGKLIAYINPATIVITDLGLDSQGFWQVSTSGPCSARFLWLE